MDRIDGIQPQCSNKNHQFIDVKSLLQVLPHVTDYTPNPAITWVLFQLEDFEYVHYL